MVDAIMGAKQLLEAFGRSLEDLPPVHGTPRLRVKKDEVSVVAHYLHTHPGLRGALSLLWAVDHRKPPDTSVPYLRFVYASP